MTTSSVTLCIDQMHPVARIADTNRTAAFRILRARSVEESAVCFSLNMFHMNMSENIFSDSSQHYPAPLWRSAIFAPSSNVLTLTLLT